MPKGRGFFSSLTSSPFNEESDMAEKEEKVKLCRRCGKPLPKDHVKVDNICEKCERSEDVIRQRPSGWGQ